MIRRGMTCPDLKCFGVLRHALSRDAYICRKCAREVSGMDVLARPAVSRVWRVKSKDKHNPRVEIEARETEIGQK